MNVRLEKCPRPSCVLLLLQLQSVGIENDASIYLLKSKELQETGNWLPSYNVLLLILNLEIL